MSAGRSFRSAGLSHVGLVRSTNEDAWLARPDIGLWAVADGMGGHARGDVASATIVSALARLPAPADARGHLHGVETALKAAHAELQRLAAGTCDICGSTVAVLLAFDRHFAVLWAGDSRVYRLRAGRLELLTRDHTLVQAMVDQGQLPPEAARLHPLRNRITRALGMPGPLELERCQGELRAGDLFLLCTDGLTSHIDDDAMAARLVGASLDAARTLVEATLDAGASDNVTVVLAGVVADAEQTWPG